MPAFSADQKLKVLARIPAALTVAVLILAATAEVAAAAVPLSCVRQYTRCINACGSNDATCLSRCDRAISNCKSPFGPGRSAPARATGLQPTKQLPVKIISDPIRVSPPTKTIGTNVPSRSVGTLGTTHPVFLSSGGRRR
jgi:hypothetical protein